MPEIGIESGKNSNPLVVPKYSKKVELQAGLKPAPEKSQQFLIPLQGIYIKEHGSGSIGLICGMTSSISQIPKQPTVNCTKSKVTLIG